MLTTKTKSNENLSCTRLNSFIKKGAKITLKLDVIIFAV